MARTASGQPLLGEIAPADEVLGLFRRTLPYTLGDEALDEIVLSWLGETLDATALGFLAARLEDRLLDGRGDYADDAYRFRDSIADYLRRLWTPVEVGRRGFGAFRHAKGSAWPSVYASFYSICLARVILDADNRTHEPAAIAEVLNQASEHEQPVSNMLRFFERCRRADGSFGEFPGSRSGMITAWAVVRVLSFLGEPADRIRADLQRYILTHCVRSSGEGTTFVNNRDDSVDDGAPCHRVVAEIDAETGILDSDTRSRSIEFLRSCQNPDGGFGRVPGAVSTMVQTRLSVLAFQSYAHGFSDRDLLATIAPGVANYLRLWEDRDFAFGITLQSSPNLAAMRDALETAAILRPVEGDILSLEELTRARKARLLHRSDDGIYSAFRA